MGILRIENGAYTNEHIRTIGENSAPICNTPGEKVILWLRVLRVHKSGLVIACDQKANIINFYAHPKHGIEPNCMVGFTGKFRGYTKNSNLIRPGEEPLNVAMSAISDVDIVKVEKGD